MNCHRVVILLVLLTLLTPAPLLAEAYYDFNDYSARSYRATSYNDHLTSYNSQQPAITLKKKGDFFALELRVENDSFSLQAREKEIRETIVNITKKTKLSAKFEVLSGKHPALLEDVRTVEILGDKNKSEASYTSVIIRMPLAKDSDAKQMESELRRFVGKVKTVGRTRVEQSSLGLSIDNPEKYRQELIEKIAQDTKKVGNQFGDDYKAALIGLDRKLQWKRVSDSEFELFIDYHFAVLPAGLLFAR